MTQITPNNILSKFAAILKTKKACSELEIWSIVEYQKTDMADY